MIYDSLNELDEMNELDEQVEKYGVSPLSYVTLNCGQ